MHLMNDAATKRQQLRLHWYPGDQNKGDATCGKGTNRITWTDQEEVWSAPENASRRCPGCLKGRG